MIGGSSSPARACSGIASGIIPVAVAPPGRRRLAVTGVPSRSAAMTRPSASTAAPDGPYGTKPLRVIVCSFIEMVTT